jgi:uroporphyrin-III C-methyltransferase
MSEENTKGKVYFVGAGPGDPDLLTIKAAKILQLADVILHDRLVSADTLLHAKDTALLILTGKQKNGDSVSQSSINELIAKYALQGKIVVRLKGGDVSFFSNILDELETVTLHQIPFEIIPGVTAASGAAAYAGIPLTARGYADAVQFLTLHHSDLLPKKDWSAIAKTTDTLVFYMTSSNLYLLTEKLLESGARQDLPICVVSQATTPMQQNYFSTISKAKEDFKETAFISPSLIIIGRVVELAHQFGWFEGKQSGIYFDELKKKNSLHHVE